MSCGLDVISVVLDDYVSEVSEQPIESSLFADRSFVFHTRKLDNANDLGHGYVYYKIYNKLSVANTETSVLTTLIEDAANKQNSFSRLESYGFKELRVKNGTNFSTVQFENEVHTIDIRLTNYSAEFNAHVIVDGTNTGVPVRTNGNTFDFGRHGENDKVPLETDDDTKNFTTRTIEDPDLYYVSLYSVFMMYDEQYEPVFSPIHYLGTVKIDPTSESN